MMKMSNQKNQEELPADLKKLKDEILKLVEKQLNDETNQSNKDFSRKISRMVSDEYDF